MRVWKRATALDICGSCANYIHAGDPLLLIHLPNVETPRHRCQTCAGEPVPADLDTRVSNPLPPLVLTFTDEDGIDRPVKPMTSMKRESNQFDWKAAQSGDK